MKREEDIELVMDLDDYFWAGGDFIKCHNCKRRFELRSAHPSCPHCGRDHILFYEVYSEVDEEQVWDEGEED